MTYVVELILFAMTPLSLRLAQLSHQSLFATLLVFNPFTIFLLITFLNKICPIKVDSFNLTLGPSNKRQQKQLLQQHNHYQKLPSAPAVDRNNNDTKVQILDKGRVSQQQYQTFNCCCSYNQDRIYVYFKYWLYSIHLTLLWSLSQNCIASLQMSTRELLLLYSSYYGLICLVQNLKNCIQVATRQLNSSYINLLEATKLHHRSNIAESGKRICNELCYMKILLNPISSKKVPFLESSDFIDTYHQDKKSKYFNDANEEDEEEIIISSTKETDTNLNDIVTNENPIGALPLPRNNSLSWKTKDENNISKLSYFKPTGRFYLILCNLLHLFILIQYLYLHLTYSCACKPLKISGFNTASTWLIWPYDCHQVFETNNSSSRGAMFCAIFSGQLLLCHMVILLRSTATTTPMTTTTITTSTTTVTASRLKS